MLYQRQVFDFVHGFDPAHRVEDYELYLRITRDFPVYSHNQVIAEYRQHRSTRSRDVLAVERAALAAHDAQQRGLARPISAENGDPLASLDLEHRVVEERKVSERKRHVIERDKSI